MTPDQFERMVGLIAGRLGTMDPAAMSEDAGVRAAVAVLMDAAEKLAPGEANAFRAAVALLARGPKLADDIMEQLTPEAVATLYKPAELIDVWTPDDPSADLAKRLDQAQDACGAALQKFGFDGWMLTLWVHDGKGAFAGTVDKGRYAPAYVVAMLWPLISDWATKHGVTSQELAPLLKEQAQ